jgi:hypothetical protein
MSDIQYRSGDIEQLNAEPTEVLRMQENVKKKRQRKPRPRLDPLKYELLQGVFEPLRYRSLRHIFADRSKHGLRRHQIKHLKELSNRIPEEASRLGKLRLRSKKERRLQVE